MYQPEAEAWDEYKEEDLKKGGRYIRQMSNANPVPRPPYSRF